MNGHDHIHRSAPVLVLGLGDRGFRDTALGLELLERVRAQWGEDPRVEFAMGGTQGIALTEALADRGVVILCDAVVRGARPGTVHVCRDAAACDHPVKGVGRDGDADDVLAAAALRGQTPPRVVLVGIEPESVLPGCGLSAAVTAALDDAADEALVALGDFLAFLPVEVDPCTS